MRITDEKVTERAYKAPRLRELGTLRELTRGNGGYPSGGLGSCSPGHHHHGELGPNHHKW